MAGLDSRTDRIIKMILALRPDIDKLTKGSICVDFAGASAVVKLTQVHTIAGDSRSDQQTHQS